MSRKRERHESTSDTNETEKRAKFEDDRTNGFLNTTIGDINGCKVFLIKKPIGMKIEDLHALKWSGDEQILSKTKIKSESGEFRAVIAKKEKKQRMVFLPAVREREETDSKNIKAKSFVHGSITILPQETKQKKLGGSIYEEGEEPLEGTVQLHPGLRKIKKTAVLDLDTRQQRNRAYGTSAARTLPNLIKN